MTAALDRRLERLQARAAAADPKRKRLVERASKGWRDQLVDLSRRNRLLYYRPYKRSVELDQQRAERALELLSGRSIPIGKIFPRTELMPGGDWSEEELRQALLEEDVDTDPGVAAKLIEIQKRGIEDREERGLETVYLAYGLASWEPRDGGKRPRAPVVMVPIAIEGCGRGLRLERSGDPEINLALLRALDEEHGCEGLAEELGQLLDDELDMPRLRVEKVIAELRRAARGVPDFTVEGQAVIDTFALQKLAMIRDLEHWTPFLAGHPIIAAMAGDDGAKAELTRECREVDPRELDQRPVDREFLILDADSSQLRAIVAVLGGASGVIVGPPGTGQSQTIANLIAELVATGKRVLFVAEKRAALEVVKERLVACGLGSLVLDLQGGSRRQIADQLKGTIDGLTEAGPVSVDTGVDHELTSQRRTLNAHAERLHRRHDLSGHSAYELMGELPTLENQGIRSRVRWRDTSLARLSRVRANEVVEVLHRAARQPELLLRTSTSPWCRARLTDATAVEAAVQHAADLADRLWPDLVERLRACVREMGLRPPRTLAEVTSYLGLLDRVESLLVDYDRSLFDLDLVEVEVGLRSAEARFSRAWRRLTDGKYRAARRRLLSARRKRAGSHRLLAEVRSALQVVADWEKVSWPGSRPKAWRDLDRLRLALAEVRRGFESLGRFVDLPDEATSLEELEATLRALADDHLTPSKIPAVRDCEAALEQLGVAELLAELRASHAPADRWESIFRHAWLASCLDRVRLAEPDLAAFHGAAQDRAVGRFYELDRSRLSTAAGRIRALHAERLEQVKIQWSQQWRRVLHQVNLKRRHLSLRELTSCAGEVVAAVRPCWMASLLVVSQVLAGSAFRFDVVVFDEASQVLPEDAVTSLVRGDAVVVAGDSNQLPPTRFFAAERIDGDAEPDQDEEGSEGFESLLDVMSSFLPSWSLEWHYRSRDERLIAFSNHHIYQDRLVTFPSAGNPAPPVRHLLVDQTRFGDTEEESSSAEVQRVVDLVFEHARDWPQLTLGVIAMGIKHANRIEAMLARRRRERPDLDAFFDEKRRERFFVKNLERVQGDERDVIILSVGYGKTAGGRLLYRFGPLLSKDGHRRLNVAVTRARHRLLLVSSFSHLDMDPGRPMARGVQLLRRAYLEYAGSGGEWLGGDGARPGSGQCFRGPGSAGPGAAWAAGRPPARSLPLSN